MDAVRGACAWIRGLCRGLGCLFFLKFASEKKQIRHLWSHVDRSGGSLRLLQWRIELVL